MRWQQLFADLRGQFEAAEVEADRADVASRARTEVGAVLLADRLRGSLGAPVSLRCRGVGAVAGVLTEVGANWLLLEDERAREVLVAAAAVLAVGGLGRLTAPAEPDSPVRSRLDLRWALRTLARDRAAVQVGLADGGFVIGTIDRVGADFVEVAEHAADEPRRDTAVRGVQAVAIDAVVTVRTLSPAWG
jgi:hypothetical protein